MIFFTRTYLFLLLVYSCSKPEEEVSSESSIRILTSAKGLADLKMAKAVNGNLLIVNSFGEANAQVALKQQFKLIRPGGEEIRSFSLVDTVYQFIDVMPGIDNGFFVSAARGDKGQQFHHYGENPEFQWSK